jgi:hypothetical protein
VELPEATGADALEAAGVDAPGVEAEADRQAELAVLGVSGAVSKVSEGGTYSSAER